jgi:hypothetical protein
MSRLCSGQILTFVLAAATAGPAAKAPAWLRKPGQTPEALPGACPSELAFPQAGESSRALYGIARYNCLLNRSSNIACGAKSDVSISQMSADVKPKSPTCRFTHQCTGSPDNTAQLLSPHSSGTPEQGRLQHASGHPWRVLLPCCRSACGHIAATRRYELTTPNTYTPDSEVEHGGIRDRQVHL